MWEDARSTVLDARFNLSDIDLIAMVCLRWQSVWHSKTHVKCSMVYIMSKARLDRHSKTLH